MKIQSDVTAVSGIAETSTERVPKRLAGAASQFEDSCCEICLYHSDAHGLRGLHLNVMFCDALPCILNVTAKRYDSL